MLNSEVRVQHFLMAALVTLLSRKVEFIEGRKKNNKKKQTRRLLKHNVAAFLHDMEVLPSELCTV